MLRFEIGSWVKFLVYAQHIGNPVHHTCEIPPERLEGRHGKVVVVSGISEIVKMSLTSVLGPDPSILCGLIFTRSLFQMNICSHPMYVESEGPYGRRPHRSA